MLTDKQRALFWAKVDFNGPIPIDNPNLGQCWPWTAALNQSGYGTFLQGLAHRASFRLAGGLIPAGYVIDHLCRTRHCVRPDHMEVVTPAENTRRGNSLPVVTKRTKRCQRGHDLSDEKNVCHTQGSDKCLICKRLGVRERYHTDPVLRAKQLERSKADRPKRTKADTLRYQTDPEYRAKVRAYINAWRARRRLILRTEWLAKRQACLREPPTS